MESGDGSHIDNDGVFLFPVNAEGDRRRTVLRALIDFFFERLGAGGFAEIVEIWRDFNNEGDEGDIDENPNDDEIEDNNEDQEDDNQEEYNHGNNENHNSLDNNDGIIDNNNEDAEVTGCSAWVEVGVNQGDEEEPLPGVSWKRSSEDDGEDIEERSSKKSRKLKSSTDSDTDSDTDFNGYNKKTVNDPNPEADPLPSPSKKRKRKTNRVDKRSSKKSRWRDESGESSTNSDTDFSGYNKNTVNDPNPDPEAGPLPSPSKKRKRKTNRVDERSSKKSRWRDESGESSTNSDTDFSGYNKNTVNGPNPEAGPLPSPSKKRKRKTNRVDERFSKKSRWRDESGESSTNSDTDFSGYNKNTVNDLNPEDDPLPSPSKKRKRKTNRVDERRSKKSRQCYEFTESNSDTVTVTPGHDLPHSSGNIEVSEDAGAAGETDKEEEEKDPRLGRSLKRKREDNEEEDMPARKRFKR